MGRETIVVLVCGDLRGHESQPEKGGKDGEAGRGGGWGVCGGGGCCSPSLTPTPPPCPARVSTAQLSSWPPHAASSCWAAPPPPTRSWSRSPRRTPTRRCLWDWCTGCCRTTSSWPGAEWSPSLSPERGLRDHKEETREERKEVRKEEWRRRQRSKVQAGDTVRGRTEGRSALRRCTRAGDLSCELGLHNPDTLRGRPCKYRLPLLIHLDINKHDRINSIT